MLSTKKHILFITYKRQGKKVLKLIHDTNYIRYECSLSRQAVEEVVASGPLRSSASSHGDVCVVG